MVMWPFVKLNIARHKRRCPPRLVLRLLWLCVFKVIWVCVRVSLCSLFYLTMLHILCSCRDSVMVRLPSCAERDHVHPSLITGLIPRRSCVNRTVIYFNVVKRDGMNGLDGSWACGSSLSYDPCHRADKARLPFIGCVVLGYH